MCCFAYYILLYRILDVCGFGTATINDYKIQCKWLKVDFLVNNSLVVSLSVRLVTKSIMSFQL